MRSLSISRRWASNLAGAQRLVGCSRRCVGCGGDCETLCSCQLAAADQAEAIGAGCLAGPGLIHLRSHQLQAGSMRFGGFVLMAGEAVVGQQAVGGIPGRLGAFLPSSLLAISLTSEA